MPISIFCATSDRPGSKANKPVDRPELALGLMFRADRKRAHEPPTLSDLPFRPEDFSKVAWVEFKGFTSEIHDYGFLNGFPELKEVRFTNCYATVEGLPTNIISLSGKDSAVQNLNRGMRVFGFEHLHLSPISNDDASTIAEMVFLKTLSVVSSLDSAIYTDNWFELSGLEKLSVMSIPFQNYVFFEHLTSLRDLKIQDIGLNSLDLIAHLPLEKLIWTEGRGPQDATRLPHINQLRELSIYQGIDDLSLVAGLMKLERLNVRPRSGDLSLLSGLH